MISVIIPVYNASKFLEKCLRSVMVQSYRDLEIIVIDDGSRDNSAEICARLAEEDPRIRLIRQENAGVSAARNRGLELACGEHILFVDSDDTLPERSMELLLEAAQPDIDMVVGSHETVRFGRRTPVIRKQEDHSAENERIDLSRCHSLLGYPWGHLYRRSIIQANHIRFDERMALGEDTAFNIAYCKFAKRIRATGDVVYRYRLGGMASYNRCYPNRHELAMLYLNAYCDYYGGKDQVPSAFLKQLVCRLLTQTLFHFIGYYSGSAACEKVRDTYALFAPFLVPEIIDEENLSPELVRCILDRDIQGTVSQFYKTKWLHILVKRIRKKVLAS